jgi:hypothetical protein
MKLNLGAGQNPVDGFVSVDKHGRPDVKHDLEIFPWPWPTSTIDEVMMYHSLEHMGRDPDIFCGIMKELYRVCCNGAIVHIAVPHPRHDNFIDDPTHVRIITPELLGCFSKEINAKAKAAGSPNSPLAVYYDVDFEIVDATFVLAEPYLTMYKNGSSEFRNRVPEMMKTLNNVVQKYRIDLRVIK